MRILLTDHLTPAGPDREAELLRLASGLHRGGHDVRCLVADVPPGAWGETGFPLRGVLFADGSAEADLDFPLPRFGPSRDGGLTFRDLTDEQLARYRETFRQAMDELVDAMDPHVIHCQHAWLHGHLALETGAPYVLSIWGPELDAVEEDSRYRRFMVEGANNASRLLVPNDELGDRLADAVEDVADRILVMTPARNASVKPLVDLYQAVYEERFGPENGTHDLNESC